MAIRKVTRRGETRLFLDITWKDASGKKHRYRQDAQVQTMTAARAEERRLLAYLGEHGELPKTIDDGAEAAVEKPLFKDAVEAYRTKVAPTKKPSTAKGYEDILKKQLEPRFGNSELATIDASSVAQLDADLARKKASAARRRNILVVLRTVLRSAVLAAPVRDGAVPRGSRGAHGQGAGGTREPGRDAEVRARGRIRAEGSGRGAGATAGQQGLRAPTWPDEERPG